MVPNRFNGKIFAGFIVALQFVAFGVFLVIAICNSSSDHVPWNYAKSDEKIDTVVTAVSTQLTTSNTSLMSVDFNPYDKAGDNLPETFPTLSDVIFSGMNEIRKSNFSTLVQSAATYTTKIDTISKADCTTEVQKKSKSVIEFFTESQKKLKDLTNKFDSLKADITDTVTSGRSKLLSEIGEEKTKIQKHVTSITNFFDSFITELQKNKQLVDVERKAWEETMKSNEEEFRRTYLIVVIVIAAIFAFIVIVCTIINIFFDNNLFRKIHFAVLCVGIVLILAFIIVKLRTANQSPEKCDAKLRLDLFKVSVPSYKPAAISDVNQCEANNETLLSNSKYRIYVVNSVPLQSYIESVDIKLLRIKNAYNLNKYADKDVEFGDFISYLNESNNCFAAQHKDDIEKYRNQLAQIASGLKPFVNFVKNVFDEMPEIAHREIGNAVGNVKLQTTVDAIDESIKKADFACLELIDVFSNALGAKCDKHVVIPAPQNDVGICLTCMILMLSLVVLLSSIGLLAKKRTIVVKKKDKEEGKVKAPVTAPTPMPMPPVVPPKKEVEKEKKEYNKVLTEWANQMKNKSFDELVAAYKLVKGLPECYKHIITSRTYLTLKNKKIEIYRQELPAYDQNRVHLKNFELDYINASWVTIPDSEKKYILSEGPIPETIPRFWQMCYQENVKHIVMLCSMIEEGNNEKCSQYFPETLNQKEKYGDFEVTYIEKKEHPLEATFWRIMKVVNTKEEGSKPLLVNHIYATWWPDKNVPEYPNPVLDLHSWLKTVHTDDSPICVHCSAGIGRTGTFVFIEYAIVQLKKKVDIIDVLIEFRSLRYLAVQQASQFIYAIICLLEYFIKNDLIDREPLREYLAEYKRWRKVQIIKESKDKKVIEEYRF